MAFTSNEIRTIFTARDRTRTAFGSMRRNLAQIERQMLGIGSLVSAGGLAVLIRQSLNTADALGKTSQKLGTTTAGLAEMRYAAELTANMAETQFDTALQRMTRRIAEAAEGTGEAKAAIRELGLDARALADAGPEAAFYAIADAMQQVETQGDRVRLGFKLFDSEGVSLVNTLALGSDGLGQMAREARQLGLAIDDIDAQKAAQANDAMTRASSALQGAVTQVAINLAPHIEDAADFLVEMETDAKVLSNTLLGTLWMVERTAVGMATIAAGFNAVGTAIGGGTAILEALIWNPNMDVSDLVDELFNQIEGEGEKRIMGIAEMLARATRDDARVPTRTLGGGGDFSDTTQQQLEAKQWLVDRHIEFETQMADATVAQLARQQQAFASLHQFKMNAQLSAAQQGIALLNVFAGQSKAAALAAMVLQKGLAIGQTFISGKAAEIRALAELGPIAGPPMALKIAAWTKLNMGLIAATGIAQAAVSGGGGGNSGGGTPDSPIVTQPLGGDSAGAQTINIRLIGAVTDAYIEDNLVPKIEDLSTRGATNIVVRRQ
mgnify:CR=1 FL=1